MICPVCKANNDQGPACRRCKADLTMLFALEEERVRLLKEATEHLRNNNPRACLRSIKAAETIRRGDDLDRLNALSLLLGRDFGNAFRFYTEREETSHELKTLHHQKNRQE